MLPRNRREKGKARLLAALKLTLRDALFHATWQERYAALRKKEIEEIAREYPAGALIRAVSLTGEAERQIQFNANFGMALFTLALGMREEKEKWRKLSS